ncbi:MAG: hypothetical protein ABID64_01790 [Nitrospirota bacterium]
MGEKMRKFAEGVEEKDLFDTILRENIFYSPIEILQLLDDSDPKVLEIFLSVRDRLEKTYLEEGQGGEAERLLDVFNSAFRKAGMVSENKAAIGRLGVTRPPEDKSLKDIMSDFAEIEDNGVLKKPSGPGRITMEIQSTRGLRDSMRGKIVLASPLIRSAVEKGLRTLDVGCPGFREFPDSIAAGGYVVFSFQDKKPPIKVEVIRLNKYESISQLVEEEGDELGKLAMGTKKEEIAEDLGRIFMEHRINECGLVVFEFRLADR